MASTPLAHHVVMSTVLVLLTFASCPPAVRAAFCGDGIHDPGEECDDGNVTPDDGCSAGCTLEPCTPAPVVGCLDAARAQIEINEKIPGRERLKLRWSKAAAATALEDFGDVVSYTNMPHFTGRVLLCLYDDGGTLIQELRVAKAGQNCPGPHTECWRKVGGSYVYKDVVGYEDGVTRIQFTEGDAGKGRASAAAANLIHHGHTHLPTGIAAALAGDASPTIQLTTSAGFCLGATMNKVTADDGLVYKAKKN